MRLFCGIPLPANALERLTALRLRLASPQDGLRWSAPEQWHLTLRFFGEVAASQAEEVASQLRGMQSQAAELALEGLGLFEAKGILFAEVEDSARLRELQATVEATAVALGLSPESRPFRPHVTLARSKGKVGHRTLRQLQGSTLLSLGPRISWLADEVLMYESVLQPTGAVYRILERVQLRS